MLLLVWLVFSHSQQGRVSCPLKVNAELSKSFRVTGRCTFMLGNGTVDAISVSRISWPLAALGSITVNNVTYQENADAAGHIEPFAILPMWTTYSARDVNLTEDVHVDLPGDSLVSFGTAEDPALLLYAVIPDAYNAREWVYGVPAWVMWLIHGLFAVIACLYLYEEASDRNGTYQLVLSGATPAKAINALLLCWVGVSLIVDVLVWSVWAHIDSGSYGGGLYWGVTVLRVLMLVVFAGVLPRYDYNPGRNGSSIAVAVLLSGYMGYAVLYMGNVDPAICIAVGTAVFVVSAIWPVAGTFTFVTLLAILLNLGAGFLAPVCMYSWCRQGMQANAKNSTPKEKGVKWKTTVFNYNLASLALHFTSAVALAYLVAGNAEWPVHATTPHYLWLPVQSNQTGQSCSDVQCKVDVQYANVGRIPLEWLVVAFHAMAVLAHLANLLYRTTYYRWLDQKRNPGRWVEYFFSASIMQVVLLVMCGYTDVWILSMSAVLMGITQVFGHATEQYLYRVDPKVVLHLADKWQFFVAGTVTFLPPWVAIYYSFLWGIENSNPGPPQWVKALIWTLVVTFASFAFVMVWYLRNRGDKYVSYKSERYYCILSIISKTLLTWQLYFGIFMRTERNLLPPS